MTKNVVADSVQMKNDQRKGSKMELFLTGEYVLHLGTCMSMELATSHQESGTIEEILGDDSAND